MGDYSDFFATKLLKMRFYYYTTFTKFVHLKNFRKLMME